MKRGVCAMAESYFSVSPLFIGVLAVIGGAIFFVTAKWLWEASLWGKETEHRVGEQMAGSRAVVSEWAENEGLILADGEIWRAGASEPLAPGDKVVVTGMDGLTLEVKKKQ